MSKKVRCMMCGWKGTARQRPAHVARRHYLAPLPRLTKPGPAREVRNEVILREAHPRSEGGAGGAHPGEFLLDALRDGLGYTGGAQGVPPWAGLRGVATPAGPFLYPTSVLYTLCTRYANALYCLCTDN